MIHPTAIIDPKANIGTDVRIGPYAVIGPNVEIGDGTTVGPHAVIEGWTRIGKENRIFQFSSVGAISQDLKYKGEEAWLIIGDRNTIREFSSLHIGTGDGGGETVVGSDNLFMANSHVAHDCRVGNRVILANGATLAGHVIVQDNAILGGLSAVHQFTRIGAHAMLSGGSMVAQDIPPYVIGQGDRAVPVAINQVGLKRRGFGDSDVKALKQAFKKVYRAGLKLEEALDDIEAEYPGVEPVEHFCRFIRDSERGIAR